MDFLIRTLLCLFLFHVSISVKQLQDFNAETGNIDSNAVGIRGKRSLVRDFMDVGSKVITGTRKAFVGTRILWRVHQIKKILLKDANFEEQISSYQVYSKSGGSKRANDDFFDMHTSLYNVQEEVTVDGDNAVIGQIGKHFVSFRKQNARCNPPCPTIEFVTPSLSSGIRAKIVAVVYSDDTIKVQRHMF